LRNKAKYPHFQSNIKDFQKNKAKSQKLQSVQIWKNEIEQPVPTEGGSEIPTVRRDEAKMGYHTHEIPNKANLNNILISGVH
jgi:hypothetical protein